MGLHRIYFCVVVNRVAASAACSLLVDGSAWVAGMGPGLLQCLSHVLGQYFILDLLQGQVGSDKELLSQPLVPETEDDPVSQPLI